MTAPRYESVPRPIDIGDARSTTRDHPDIERAAMRQIDDLVVRSLRRHPRGLSAHQIVVDAAPWLTERQALHSLRRLAEQGRVAGSDVNVSKSTWRLLSTDGVA